MHDALVTSALMLSGLMLFGDGHLFGTGDVRPLLVSYGLAGFFNCILWFIPQSMLVDVADESELITGRRREGALFGLFSFGQKIAAGVALLLAGGLMEWFAGLQPGDAQQSALTVHRIGIASSVVPAVLFLAAAMVILGYKLTRTRVGSIQAELHERRVRAGTAAE